MGINFISPSCEKYSLPFSSYCLLNASLLVKKFLFCSQNRYFLNSRWKICNAPQLNHDGGGGEGSGAQQAIDVGSGGGGGSPIEKGERASRQRGEVPH